MKKRNNNLNINKFILFICFSYGFIGINFIISGVVIGLHSRYFSSSIMIAILMLFRGSLALFDERKEMRGKFYAVLCGVVHFCISIFLAYVHSLWSLLILYLIEFIVSIVIIHIVTSKKHK